MEVERLSGHLIGIAIIAAAACRSAPNGGMPVTSSAPPAVADSARPRFTEADVRFMQGMIAHHAQALAMTSLLPTRTHRADMRLLAERIEVSQKDEINLMRRWLLSRGQDAPDPSNASAHHGHHGVGGAAGQPMLMPGMLTDEQLAQLASAKGAEFDRLFLQFMIRHHEGALTMVAQLFGTTGAAQASEVYRFAADVEADQRAEIARMRAVLATMPPA